MPLSQIKDRATAMRVAAAAPCDVRTAARYLETQLPVMLSAAGAIRRALSDLGLPDPRAAKEVRP